MSFDPGRSPGDDRQHHAERSWRIARRFGVGALVVFLAAVLNWGRFFGEARLFVLVPDDEDVELRLDDREPVVLPRGTVFRAALARRHEHRVQTRRLNSGRTGVYRVQVRSAVHHTVVPAGDRQCFGLLDIKEVIIGRATNPRVQQLFSSTQAFTLAASQPFPRPAHVVMGPDEVPAQVWATEEVLTLQPWPCDAEGASVSLPPPPGSDR